MWIVELARKRKLIICRVIVDKSSVKNVCLFYVFVTFYFLIKIEISQAFCHTSRAYFYYKSTILNKERYVR